jgi:type VI secretion system protein ImpF
VGEIERLKQEVLDDLEWLLNSRKPPLEIPPGAPGLRKSVVAFGLPDFTGLTFSGLADRDRLVGLLETAIRDFEPRLSDVKVTFDRAEKRSARGVLHYRIDALLHVDPAPEPVRFQTDLDLSSRKFSVKLDGG